MRTGRPWDRRGPSRAWPELLCVLVLAVGAEARAGETWAIEHARVVPSPTGAVVEDGTVAVKDGRVKKGDLVLFEAMGGGFTWGSALVRW